MKYLRCVCYAAACGLLLLCGLNAAAQQAAVPARVYLSEKASRTMPPVYAFADNYFCFVTDRKIDSITLQDENGFVIRRLSDSVWKIMRGLYTRPVIHPSFLHVAVYYSGGFNRLAAPLQLFPPVKVVLMNQATQTEIPVDDTTVKAGTQCFCHAAWDYPTYAHSIRSYRGHFRVTMMYKKEVLGSAEGWNDTGDNTHFFPLPDVPMHIEVDKGSLYTTRWEDAETSELEPLKLSSYNAGGLVYKGRLALWLKQHPKAH